MGFFSRIFRKRPPKLSIEDRKVMQEIVQDRHFRIPAETTGKEEKSRYYGNNPAQTRTGERPAERMQREIQEKRRLAEERAKMIQGGMSPGQADKELKKRK